MATITDRPTGPSDDTSHPPPVKRPYVPPRLAYLGNVRDALQKSGPSADQPKTHPKRP